MLHELRTYTLVPGGVRDYLRIYNEVGRETQVRVLGNLVALLQPESGDLNQLVFIWAYENFEQRRERRARLMADAQFTEFRKAVKHLLVSQESRLMNAA
jgi:hypothetical protein